MEKMKGVRIPSTHIYAATNFNVQENGIERLFLRFLCVNNMQSVTYCQYYLNYNYVGISVVK